MGAINPERHVRQPESVEQSVRSTAHFRTVGQLDEVVGPRCDRVRHPPDDIVCRRFLGSLWRRREPLHAPSPEIARVKAYLMDSE